MRLTARAARLAFGYTPTPAEVVGAVVALAQCVLGVVLGDLVTALTGFAVFMAALDSILKRRWRLTMLVAGVGYVLLIVLILT